MPETPGSHVTRRRVFYIPGYDPYPPQRYRELYRAESAKQATISDYSLTMRQADDRATGWETMAEIEGRRTQTRFEVLTWSDIVRQTMDQTIPATYGQLARVAWTYLSSGALRRLMWLRKGPIIAGFYPVLMLLAQAFLAWVAGLILAGTATGLLGWGLDAAVGLAGFGPLTDGAVWGWISWLLSLAIILGTMLVLLRLAQKHDGRLCAYYLMHDLAYTTRFGGAWPGDLDDRIDRFAERIGRAMDEGVDEILVVGHSSGAQLAVGAVARVLRARPPGGPALSLLTLGQAIPMMSFLPKAVALRRDLHDLSGSDRITWLDVSAPGDGCSFALCDPVAVTGVQPDRPLWPLVISAAYSRTLKPETLAALRGRFFRLHYQYLCAFDRPGDYDYFRITAGPMTLGERFRGRKPSVSRIDVPASGYRTMAA